MHPAQACIRSHATAVSHLLPSLQAEKDGPKALDEFCKDLCAEVRAGRIDPVIGRESEVRCSTACCL
jgi:ATP-dependent Clp protease ATP-binding subunit ClpA